MHIQITGSRDFDIAKLSGPKLIAQGRDVTNDRLECFVVRFESRERGATVQGRVRGESEAEDKVACSVMNLEAVRPIGHRLNDEPDCCRPNCAMISGDNPGAPGSIRMPATNQASIFFTASGN